MAAGKIKWCFGVMGYDGHVIRQEDEAGVVSWSRGSCSITTPGSTCRESGKDGWPDDLERYKQEMPEEITKFLEWLWHEAGGGEKEEEGADE